MERTKDHWVRLEVSEASTGRVDKIVGVVEECEEHAGKWIAHLRVSSGGPMQPLVRQTESLVTLPLAGYPPDHTDFDTCDDAVTELFAVRDKRWQSGNDAGE